jgi:hypothetical protein
VNSVVREGVSARVLGTDGGRGTDSGERSLAEVAAVVAALRRFATDTSVAMPAVVSGPFEGGWVRAARLEAVGLEGEIGSGWGPAGQTA